MTDIRLERVTSISRADALAEGFEPGVMMDGTVNGQPAKIAVIDPVYWFAMVWNSIHGKGAYADDPWVWAVSFRLLDHPAREMSGHAAPTTGGHDGYHEREKTPPRAGG